MLLGTVNAVMVSRILRPIGVVGAALGGLGYAVRYPAVYVEWTTQLQGLASTLQPSCSRFRPGSSIYAALTAPALALAFGSAAQQVADSLRRTPQLGHGQGGAVVARVDQGREREGLVSAAGRDERTTATWPGEANLCPMIWVVIFAGIAVAGLIMVVSYVIWLAHKASDVMSEVGVLGDRAGQLMELLSQIQVPERRFDAPDRDDDALLNSNPTTEW